MAVCNKDLGSAKPSVERQAIGVSRPCVNACGIPGASLIGEKDSQGVQHQKTTNIDGLTVIIRTRSILPSREVRVQCSPIWPAEHANSSRRETGHLTGYFNGKCPSLQRSKLDCKPAENRAAFEQTEQRRSRAVDLFATGPLEDDRVERRGWTQRFAGISP